MPNFASMEVLIEAYVPYRKHSSGDLQSRLKTRKILGVGETDNGDVHRSKISQVLGHNEHLFVKLPRCYLMWHMTMATMFTVGGFVQIFFPLAVQDTSTGPSEPLQMMATDYGSIALGFAFLLWSTLGTTDKSLARGLMAAIIVVKFIQLGALLNSGFQTNIWEYQTCQNIFLRLVETITCGYFFWAIGSTRAGLRRSMSNKDLREDQHPSPSSPGMQQVPLDYKKLE